MTPSDKLTLKNKIVFLYVLLIIIQGCEAKDKKTNSNIGITAITTPTGVYPGYDFAIPFDIVKKVGNDLVNFGSVRREVLAINILDLNSTLAKKISSNRSSGVCIDSVTVAESFKETSVKEKDGIINIDNKETASVAKLQEIMLKPAGEQVKIALPTNGNEKKEVTTTLKKQEAIPAIKNSKNIELLKDLGIELSPITSEDQKVYNVKNGLKITKMYYGRLKRYTSIRQGFVIISVNNKSISSVKSFMDAVASQQRGIMFEGKYAGDPTRYYYTFGM